MYASFHGCGIIGLRAPAVPSVGTGIIVRGELVIVIQGSAAVVLPPRYPPNVWAGVWTGADVDLENEWEELAKIRLRELKGLGRGARERMAARVRLGHVQLQLLITLPADEPDFGQRL